MNVFICNSFIKNKAFLDENEAHHCTRVLRKKVGDAILLMDGKGSFYEGIIESANKKTCVVTILEVKEEAKHPYYLHLLVAPTKNIARYEWFIEKAIEIGVDEITPVFFDHSERRKLKLERINKIALSAVKQSLSPYFPVLNDAITFDQLIQKDISGNKFVSHLVENAAHLKNKAKSNDTNTIIIGPEGDFSERELKELDEKNWEFVILGNKRLRTETAAVVATQIINGLHF